MKHMKHVKLFEQFVNNDLSEATVMAVAAAEVLKPSEWKRFTNYVKKHNVTVVDKKSVGPNGRDGVEITLKGARKDLEFILSDDRDGFGDSDLIDYIEESLSFVNETLESL